MYYYMFVWDMNIKQRFGPESKSVFTDILPSVSTVRLWRGTDCG
jgi:hypothetical protein